MKAFGNSKLARKFAWLFIVCAFVPTMLLIWFSYERVSAQMTEQSVDKLTKDTKTYGLALFDRLVRLSDQMRFTARVIETRGIGSGELAATLRPESLDLFEGLVIMTESGELITLFGEPLAPPFEEIEQLHQRNRSTEICILTRPAEDGHAEVYFIHHILIPGTGLLHLIGTVAIAPLWGIGEVPLLPTATELAVYDENGQPLIATYGSPGTRLYQYTADRTGRNLWNFEYDHEGRRYHAGLWNLFLQSRFEAGVWTIVLSQPEDYMLSALQDFRANLFRVIMLGLLVILLLSVNLIRKRLAPLDKLKTKTEQIARKNFSETVEIDSGDEFEDLARSFNFMSRQIQRQFSALETIDRIDRAILSSLDFNDLIGTALPMTASFFDCDLVFFGRLLDPTSRYLKGHYLRRGMTVPESSFFHLSAADYQELIVPQQPQVWAEDRPMPDSLEKLEVGSCRSILMVSLQQNRQHHQGLLLLGQQHQRSWDEEEQGQLRQLAAQISIAMTNAELVDNLEKLAKGTIEALARTVDAKSKWTSGHSERVSDLAGRIGETMGLEAGRVDILYRAGLLHDIGKIAIPLAILDKPDRLSDEEFKEIQTHPEIGAKILEPIEAYQDIIPIIIQHHERFDGNGYPHGLAGENIDLLARILAVADVYDALSSSRPYRGGWVQDKVMHYITSKSGTLFDPKVVEAFRATVVGAQQYA